MEENIILKLAYLGYISDLNLKNILDWFSKKYEITIIKDGIYLRGYYKSQIFCVFIIGEDENSLCSLVIPELLKLWKCKDGILSGPSINNYENPNTEWS